MTNRRLFEVPSDMPERALSLDRLTPFYQERRDRLPDQQRIITLDAADMPPQFTVRDLINNHKGCGREFAEWGSGHLSAQMKNLEKKGVLVSEKNGKNKTYAIADKGLRDWSLMRRQQPGQGNEEALRLRSLDELNGPVV
ncbi:MAG: hypothetical protein K9G62_07630 [Alphaproteobacteria bacterium]|nr:hypothetical protein [Alphaproteobacteria bacterium]